MSQLGDRVRKARKAYGMSVVALARRIGITRQQLYMIESNKTVDPGVVKVKSISDILGVSLNYLLRGTEDASEGEPATPVLEETYEEEKP